MSDEEKPIMKPQSSENKKSSEGEIKKPTRPFPVGPQNEQVRHTELPDLGELSEKVTNETILRDSLKIDDDNVF